MNFYHNFLRLCNEVGKSPSKVILEVGGTKSAITRWKNGSNPTDATAQKIANYFGVPIDVLKYGLSEQEIAVIDALEKGVFEDIKKTADQKVDGLRGLGYDNLTPENKAVIDALIDTLLKSQSGGQ